MTRWCAEMPSRVTLVPCVAGIPRPGGCAADIKLVCWDDFYLTCAKTHFKERLPPRPILGGADNSFMDMKEEPRAANEPEIIIDCGILPPSPCTEPEQGSHVQAYLSRP